MENGSNSILGFAKEKITGIDIYGRKITLMHNGQYKFKTLCGGLLSICALMIVVVYILILIIYPIKLVSLDYNVNITEDSNNSNSSAIVTANNITWTKEIVPELINNHYERYSVNETAYLYPYWTFMARSLIGDDPTYFSLNFYKYYDDGNGPVNKTISYSKCNNNGVFPDYGYFRFFDCPNTTELYLDMYSQFMITIDKCTGAGCHTDAEIQAYLKTTQIQVLTFNSYYDVRNKTNPIQKYLGNCFYYQPSVMPKGKIEIDQTDVQFYNGPTISLFETSNSQEETYIPESSFPQRIGVIFLHLSTKYYIIKEKQNYQPVIGSRMLSDNLTYSFSPLNHSKVLEETEYQKSFVASNSTLTVNQMGGDRNWYYPFFVMSQIGGILYFFKAVFGTLWSFFSEKLLIFDILLSFRKLVKDKLYNKSNNKSRKRKQSLNKVKPRINSEEDKQKTEKSKRDKLMKVTERVSYDHIRKQKQSHKRKPKVNNDEYPLDSIEARYFKYLEDKQKLSNTLDISKITLEIRELKKIVEEIVQTNCHNEPQPDFAKNQFIDPEPQRDIQYLVEEQKNPRKKDEESYPELHEIELIKNEIKVRAKVSKESQNLFNPRPDINTKEVANSNKRLKFSNILSREIESIFEESKSNHSQNEYYSLIKKKVSNEDFKT